MKIEVSKGDVIVDESAWNKTIKTNEQYFKLGTPDEITAALSRLAEYEAAERDGRLARLPCKVGEYWERDGKRYIVAEITMTNAWGIMVRHYEEGNGEMLSCNPQYFAKHYTRAEAEGALKGAEHERD